MSQIDEIKVDIERLVDNLVVLRATMLAVDRSLEEITAKLETLKAAAHSMEIG